MAFKITGPGFAQLKEWERVFNSADALLPAISETMAEEAIGLIQEGFRKERDPYGKRWKRKQRSDGRKVLSGKTSRLKSGWHRKQSGKGGFTVAPSVDYASHHQSGTSRMVARRMIPTKNKGLPPSWARAFEEDASDVLKASLGGGGGGRIGIVAAKLAAIRRALGVRMIIRRAVSRASSE